ncbi:MAG: hypothetical protein ACRCUJ_06800 [Phocaeicola sp.]
MDAKLVITSFDELRKLIIEQFKNLSKQMESAKSTPPTVDTSQIKELIRNIPQPDLSNLEQSAANTNALIRSEFQRSQEQLHELNEKLDNRQPAPLPLQKHLHTVELKSSKVVVALVSLGVALFSSASYNIYQFTANSHLSDNDIKFRYIKAFGEITPENLLKLETIFEYEPDKQKQRSIRQMVEEHEQGVEQRAQDLEQARLKEAQAEQLRKEAERIKQKK